MKKLLLSVGLAFASVSGFGQQHDPHNLLAVKSINVATNGLGVGVTNVVLYRDAYGHSLATHTNTVYTNANGSQIRGGTAKLFNNVPLYTDRNGMPIMLSTQVANAGTSLNSNLTYFGSQTLVIEVVNPAANPSNGPIGIVMTPYWDDTTVGTTNGTSVEWAVVLPGLASRKYTVATNIPTHRWIGAKAFTVKYITNHTDLAGAEALTNGPVITKLLVVGHRP